MRGVGGRSDKAMRVKQFLLFSAEIVKSPNHFQRVQRALPYIFRENPINAEHIGVCSFHFGKAFFLNTTGKQTKTNVAVYHMSFV